MKGDYFQHYYSNQQWFSLAFLCLPFLLMLIFQFLTRHYKGRSSSNLPPGPGPLPIIGDLHRLGQFPYKSLQKMSQKYGDIIYLKLGQVPLIVFSSRELVEKVAKAHDLDFCNRAQRVSFKKFTYNFRDVAFSPCNTDSWKQVRRLYTQELLSNKRVEISRSIREEMVARTVNQIEEVASANPGQSINLSDFIMVLVQDIICGTYLGESWTTDPNERKRIIAALEELNDLCGNSCIADYLPWARWVDVLTGYNKRMEKSFDVLDKYIEGIIHNRVANQTCNEKELQEDQEDFVDSLLRLEKNGSLTREHVKANIPILFLAATDSSTTIITWTMTELMRNKRIRIKATKEVRQVCGSKRKVEESDCEKLPYLKALVKESMRLHVPAPLLVPRESIRQTTIDGFEIPAKSQTVINMYSICRDPRYWESPLEYLPERFLNSPIDYKGNHFEFLVFGGGRRICPGMKPGVAIVELALANLLYAFDWELPRGMGEDDVDMSEKNGLAVTKKTPLVAIPKCAVRPDIAS